MNRVVLAVRREFRPDRLCIWVVVVLLTLGLTLTVADGIAKVERLWDGFRASQAQKAREDD